MDALDYELDLSESESDDNERQFTEQNLFTILFAICVKKNNTKCLMFKQNLVLFCMEQMDHEYHEYGGLGMGIQRVANHVAFVGDLPLVNFILANRHNLGFFHYYAEEDRHDVVTTNLDIYEVIEHAALGGHIGLIKYFTDGKPISFDLEFNNMMSAELLEKYFHGKDEYVALINQAIAYARKFGHSHVVKYFMEHRCPCNLHALRVTKNESMEYLIMEETLRKRKCLISVPVYPYDRWFNQ